MIFNRRSSFQNLSIEIDNRNFQIIRIEHVQIIRQTNVIVFDTMFHHININRIVCYENFHVIRDQKFRDVFNRFIQIKIIFA